jgi:hypothetical protein
MEKTQLKFPMRAYTAMELSRFYKVCKKTFMRWLRPFEEQIGERQGRYYNINQVKTIIEKLGMPGGYED